MRSEPAVFIAVVIAVSSLVFIGSLPPKPAPLGWIAWSPGGANPCQGNYTGEAVIIGRQFASGCTADWVIMIPPSEHGNLTKQSAYLASNGAGLAGIFLDDFDLQNASTQSRMLAAVPAAFGGQVCPVIYAYGNQPDSTKGTACVALAITPRAAATFKFLSEGEGAPGPSTSDSKVANRTSVSAWLQIFRNATGYVDAKRVMILAFGRPFAGWSYPVPPAYLEAMDDYAQGSKLTLVYFGPLRPS
ncbi:MAG TPA: hypothetical protein VKF15_01550 [Nitrososphaerales archaeon]|nr:hypothetical protein [Nitrososphaerales archaeon]